MGFATARACHGSPDAAALAYCAEVAGVAPSGVVSCSAVSSVVLSTTPQGDWATVTYTLRVSPLDGSTPVQNPAQAVLAPCEPKVWELDTADGVELGWLVVGVLAVAVAFRLVSRALRTDEAPPDA